MLSSAGQLKCDPLRLCSSLCGCSGGDLQGRFSCGARSKREAEPEEGGAAGPAESGHDWDWKTQAGSHITVKKKWHKPSSIRIIIMHPVGCVCLWLSCRVVFLVWDVSKPGPCLLNFDNQVLDQHLYCLCHHWWWLTASASLFILIHINICNNFIGWQSMTVHCISVHVWSRWSSDTWKTFLHGPHTFPLLKVHYI